MLRAAPGLRPSLRLLAPATVLALLATACPGSSPGPAAATADADASRATSETEAGGGADAEAPANDADAPAPGDGGAKTAAAEPPPPGADLTPQARAIFRMVACGGDDAWLPAKAERATVDTHCGLMKDAYAEFKKEWLDVAGPFLAKLRPATLPKTVVYPFGGGDLLTALATYPDADEITTISLEPAADIRGVDGFAGKPLAKELATLREHLGKLFLKVHSRTINMQNDAANVLPGEVAFMMAALAFHGYEPRSFRYVTLGKGGALGYVGADDLAKYPPGKAPKALVSHAEVRFGRPGDARTRTFRHLSWDLSDANLKRKPEVVEHLEAKGKVAMMTKAASHLLWSDKFSTIRDYVATHTDWMISDTTCLPPRLAKKAGFVQDVYGIYEWPEPFGEVNVKDATDFKNLFKEKGGQALPFRYGYPDSKSHGHIVVTRRP